MSERRQASFANSPDDETWLDFLRSAGGTATSSSSTANTRPTPPSADSSDRKRRLTSAESGRTYPYNAPGSDRHTPIDLISPPRRQPSASRRSSNSSHTTRPLRRPTEWGSMAARRPSDMPPPWQPDAQVTKCPVCEEDFGFLFRKHHCRKCGRVVCANCSPHRITIPREYIVQPPGSAAEFYAPYSGGADVVRVCKPCVPDPWTPQTTNPLNPQNAQQNSNASNQNPLAMPQHHSHQPSTRRASEAAQSRYHRRSSIQHPHAHMTDANLAAYLGVRDRTSNITPATDQTWRTSRSHYPTITARPRGSTVPTSTAPQSTAQNIPGQGDLSRLHGHGHHHLANRDHTHAHPAPGQGHSHPRVRREVKEEDECPVCGIEMPPGAAYREAHIADCVTNRFSTPPAPSTTAPAAPTNPRDPNLPSGSTPPNASRARAPSYRSRGMIPYTATEKDCIDGEGREQECTICMVEFSAGDEMARLECLCKYHRSCIREWWRHKGLGSCPVHVCND